MTLAVVLSISLLLIACNGLGQAGSGSVSDTALPLANMRLELLCITPDSNLCR